MQPDILFHLLLFFKFSLRSEYISVSKTIIYNNLGGGTVIRTWDQEVCSLCDFRFEPCGCSYDGHWRLT